LSGHEYLATSRVLAPMHWRLIVLDDLSAAFAAARRGALVTMLGAGAAFALALLVWQRQRMRRLERAHEQALQASRDSLDSKVSERTLALRAANVTLRNELEARKAIEEDLRATQNQLVHVGKMAVLGQMSGAVVNELNEPLQALRAMVDQARERLRQGRQPHAPTGLQLDLQADLPRMSKLAEQLGRLTQQLRAFAERHDEPRVAVPLRHAITNAQFEVSSRLREDDVMMEVRVQPPALAVLAEESRLEQVLVNLIGNAIDAMAGAPVRHVKVEAEVRNGRCVITIGDTGPGIRPNLLPRLFEPFTTSRPPGTGLDLGLMLAAHIVLESGGSLRASNLQTGGACVVIELPLAKSREMALHE
jgi:two-component system, NtrC family, C4-dicarboxylate transport sensor histidine kinase DctB